MKTLFTTAAALAAVMAAATASYAKDCNAVAQAAVDAQTHPVGSTLLGCGIGAGVASLLTGGNGHAITGGCAAGGATGFVLSADKRQHIYNDAYAACMKGSGPKLVNYTTFPPPSTSAITSSTKTINVRIGPGLGFDVQETLPPNTAVSVAVCSNTEWCQIGGYKGPGWVASSLLTFN